jgi:hypothetical protein
MPRAISSYKVTILEKTKSAHVTVPYHVALAMREKYGPDFKLKPELTDEGILYRPVTGEEKDPPPYPAWLRK